MSLPPSSEPIISVSGLRGVVGTTLTPDVAVRYISAFAAQLPAGPVVVTHDGRTSGPYLSNILIGTLAATGRKVIEAGVAATPTTGVLVREHHAAGGVQISASHNPPEYNGFKLFSELGRVIPAEQGLKVLDRYRKGNLAWVTHETIGHMVAISDTFTAHWNLLQQIVDVQLIRKKRLTVLLDANHGAGSRLARRMLEELGCRVKILGGEPNGRFEHPPEPTEENLRGVFDAVKNLKADVGFCQDPDADRLAVIDEQGKYLGEEYTLALCVDHVLRRRKGPIVTNCSSSRMTADLCAKYKVPYFRSAVGEANVCDLMIEQKAILGGEGSGGVIDPRVGYVRDSFVGMAMLLEAIASRDKPISQLAAELPQYSIAKTKIRFPNAALNAGYAALEKHFAGAAIDKMDGLRLDWDNKWLLIRASNTEPVVRAIAEAPTTAEAAKLCKEASEVLGVLA